MNRDAMQSLLLMVEALLIIVCLVLGQHTTFGMICYWVIVAANHLTDYIVRRINDRRK